MAQKHNGLALVIGIGKPKGPMDNEAPMGDQQRRQHAADVEAAFTGRPQPHGTFDAEHDGGQVSARSAGYMELGGAAKDGDCDLVAVPGGVSAERGCCNLFEPASGAQHFACGECEHFHGEATQAAQQAATSSTAA